MRTYILHTDPVKPERIEARDAEHLVEKMFQTHRGGTKSVGEYRVVTGRCTFRQIGQIVRVDTSENLIADLIRVGLIHEEK